MHGRSAYLHIQHRHITVVTNYDREWQSVYFDKKFEALDPVVKRARSRKHISTCSGEQERPTLSNNERSFYESAADFGITIPIRTAHGSMSMFTLASEKPLLHLDREIDAVAQLEPINLVKIEISAVTTDRLLVFLNEGISKLVKSYQILETIDDKDQGALR